MGNDDITFEEFCNRLDAEARRLMPAKSEERLAFESVDTTDGMNTRKQLGRWIFDGRIFILNKASATTAWAGYEASTVSPGAPSMKMVSIRADGVKAAVHWITWLTAPS